MASYHDDSSSSSLASSPLLQPDHLGQESQETFAFADFTLASDDGDQQVKIALIRLLNCPTIKKDPDSRMWIQNRLMDAELRLRQRRRRRLSSCVPAYTQTTAL
ncbi:hypothetical protein AAP_04815 [Ascosphaera apis ARSEF 7405]|uniref:Uncharacterized protein n=1 Tax=Ascosphaera apis ARSEF 7405 TaxID=392613 RepID=A0A167WDS8_9EURO|nr:hypothetical protein AAP_04815 [Ascosphaera apis ARSEF 7405]